MWRRQRREKKLESRKKRVKVHGKGIGNWYQNLIRRKVKHGDNSSKR